MLSRPPAEDAFDLRAVDDNLAGGRSSRRLVMRIFPCPAAVPVRGQAPATKLSPCRIRASPNTKVTDRCRARPKGCPTLTGTRQ